MFRISRFKVLMAVVAILLLVPAMLPAVTNTCEPPYCPASCEGGYDCTQEWIWADYNNMQLAMMLWMAGYNVTVCCSQ